MPDSKKTVTLSDLRQECAVLLRQNNEEAWANWLESATIDELLRGFGGMGSFSDLLLYQDEQITDAANDALDSLRAKIYSLLTEKGVSE